MIRYLLILVIIATTTLQCSTQENLLPGNSDINFTLDEIGVLDKKLVEISGLLWMNGILYGINDGGNGDKFYTIDPSNGNTLNMIEVEGTKNIDWEGMAGEGENIFIGDFGNNNGKREDLKIYVLEKDHEEWKKERTIKFTYEDQQELGPPYFHNFDCEAMIIGESEITLFTKNYRNGGTHIYTLDKSSEESIARRKQAIDLQGIVTDGCIDPVTGDIVLISYTRLITHYLTYLHTLSYNEGSYTLNNTYELPIKGQLESIAHKNGASFYLATEDSSFSKSLLYEITLNH